jgi:MFS family permease
MSVQSIRRRYGLVTFLIWFAVALPMALSILLIQERGLTLGQIGFVLGAYSLIIVLLEVPTGGLADAIGRKRVALVAYSLAALSSVGVLLAFSFPTYLAAMLLYGVARALSSGALDAWYVDELQAADPDIDLQPALAGVETIAMLALGLGTLIGSALPRVFVNLPPDGTAIWTPLATPIGASLVVYGVLLASIALLIQETRPISTEAGRQSGFKAVPTMVKSAFDLSRKNGRFVLLMVASLAGGFTLIGLESFWQPFFATLPGTQTADGSPQSLLFGIILAGYFLVGMAGNLLSGPLSRKLDRRYGLVGALSRLLQGGFLLLLAYATALIPAAAFYWLVFLMVGVGASPHATLVNAEIPAAQRSTMLSVQSLAFYAGGFLGGALLGWVAESWSIGMAWTIAAGVIALSAVVYLGLDHGRASAPVSSVSEALQ